MANRCKTDHARCILTATLIAVMSIGWATAPPAQAGDLKDLDTSLKLIPQDAAFYTSTLRLGEQIEAVGESRAWAKLIESPAIQMGLMVYAMQAGDPQSPAGQFKAALENPEIRPLLDLGFTVLVRKGVQIIAATGGI